MRLAGAQVLPTATFATRHFAKGFASVAHAGGRNLYGGRGVWMNGMGRWAGDMVARLHELNGRDDLAGLTALPWKGVLAPGGLTANIRRWCPHCYRDMRGRHGECWDPLAWFLAPVTCCAVHVCPFEMRCRDCGAVQPWLPHDTVVGWCAVCGTDLAATALDSGKDPGNEAIRSHEEWAALACAELCAASRRAARDPSAVVSQSEFSSSIRWLVAELDDGNRSAFSRRVDVSVHTPSRWIRTGTIRLDSLLRLCMQLGLRPTDLLLRDREIRVGPSEVDDIPRRRRRSEIDWVRVETEFAAILCDCESVSLRDAARMLRVRVNSLRKRLPAKVEELRRHSLRVKADNLANPAQGS